MRAPAARSRSTTSCGIGTRSSPRATSCCSFRRWPAAERRSRNELSMSFKIQKEPIDPHALEARLRDDRAGACVTFEGWVRDHNDGEAVTALDYEAHEPIAVAEEIGRAACRESGE